MRFGMWNVRNLYGAGSLTAAARELARYKFNVVGVQAVKWDKGGMIKEWNYSVLFGRGKKIIIWEQDFLYTTE